MGSCHILRTNICQPVKHKQNFFLFQRSISILETQNSPELIYNDQKCCSCRLLFGNVQM